MRPKVSIPPIRKSNAPINPYAEVLARPRSDDVADAHRQTSSQEKLAKLVASGGETRRGTGRSNGRGNGRVLGRGSWSPRSTPLPPQQSKVSKSGAAPGFAAVPPQNVAVTSPIPIPNPAQVSLSVASIVEGLSHGHVSRVTGASSSTGNAPSVQPSTTEVSKVSSTSQTPPASPPTSATRSTPPLKTPSVSPTTVVNKVAPPLKTRSISPSAHAVTLNDAEILAISAATDPVSSAAPVLFATSTVTQVSLKLNKMVAIAIEGSSTAPKPVLVPPPTSALVSQASSPTAGSTWKMSSPVPNVVPVPSSTSALARISPVLNTTAASAAEKSSDMVLVSSPTAAVVATSSSLAVSNKAAPVLNNALVALPRAASLAKGPSTTIAPLGPLPMIIAGRVPSRPDLDPSYSSGVEGYSTKPTTSSSAPATSIDGASSKQKKTLISTKWNAAANFIPTQNVSSALPPASAADAPPAQFKPPVPPPASSVAEIASAGNTAPISPILAAIPQTTPSKLKVAPALELVPSEAKAISTGNMALVLSAIAGRTKGNCTPITLPSTTSAVKISSTGKTDPLPPYSAGVSQTTPKLKVAPNIPPSTFAIQNASSRNIAPVLLAPVAVLHESSASKMAVELPQTSSTAKALSTKHNAPVPRFGVVVPKHTTKSKAAVAMPPSAPIRNMIPVLPFPEKEPSIASRLVAVPAVSPAASTAKKYPGQKPTPESQSVKTALKESTSSALPPAVSAAKALPVLDTSSALTKDGEGLGSLTDSVQVPQQSPLSPRKSVRNVASHKAQAEPTPTANLAESFKRLKIELESTVAEGVGKKGMKIAFLMVEIEAAEKLQSSTKELLNAKQKTVASMEVVINGLRELNYDPQGLREREHQISVLKCETEGLEKRLQSIVEQIKFKEQEIRTLKLEVECLKQSSFNRMELEKAKDHNFARLKVEIEKLKMSQKAAEKFLDVKEHRIIELQSQVESRTGSLQTAEKTIDLNGKEILSLRAALAFKSETDELKNARANRDLDLLDNNLKQTKEMRLEIERLKKSQRKKDNVVEDDQEISALKLEIERLTKSQQMENVAVGKVNALKTETTAVAQRPQKNKMEHPGNSKEGKCKPAINKRSKVQAVSKTPKAGDPRKINLMGPLIYFTNDELGIPTYEMDFVGGSYMPNELEDAENDRSERAIQAFTATGTGIQIHITKKTLWRTVILLFALLFSFSRIPALYRTS